MKNSILFAFAALSLTACETFIGGALPGQNATSSVAQTITEHTITSADYAIMGAKGAKIGSLNLTDGPHGLLVRVNLEAGSLTPGWHGLHFHQTGDCSDLGVFKLSGGHVGKIESGHGLLNPAGPGGGDAPNIYAHTDGAAGMEFITSRTSLPELRDADGAALVIHADPDDQITQPIGGAGARVACAVIK